MILAKNINDGNCSECGAKKGLYLTINREKGMIWGYVGCIKCGEWITDMPVDELLDAGLITPEEVKSVYGDLKFRIDPDA